MERECSFRYVKTDKPSDARCTLRQSERAHERSHSPGDWCDSQARKYEVQYTVQDREDLLGMLRAWSIRLVSALLCR